MAIINDIEISDMAFNGMVRKMHNRIISYQNLFSLQQSSLDKFLFDDYVDDLRERKKKLKMWDDQAKWEQIEFKKKRDKKEEEQKIELAKAKQKELENKYILKLKENSYRNELFYAEMNSTLNRMTKIIIVPNLMSNRRWSGAGFDKYCFQLSFYKENKIDLLNTDRFFGGSRKDYNYTILKHKILDKMIQIAKDNNFTSIVNLRFVFTKPFESINVFVYFNHLCLFQIDLPEF